MIVRPPQSGPLDGLADTPRAVMLRLYPPNLTGSLKPAPLPRGWIETAWRWLTDHLVDDTVHVRASSLAQFSVPAKDMAGLAGRYPDEGPAIMVTGEMCSRVWAIHLNVNLVLAFGGPDATDAEVVAMAQTFRDMARRLAPEVGQAFVDIAERFGPFTNLCHGTDWHRSGGESPVFVDWVCDQLCFDGFAYQLLGPGHLARLAAASPDRSPPAQLRPLASTGRVELAVGEFADWLPDAPQRARVLEETRAVLRPCLLRRGESQSLLDQLWRRRGERRPASRWGPWVRSSRGRLVSRERPSS